MAYRPVIGALELLVYRECQEGCWCATGEGALPPRCNLHGLPMFPGGGPEGMYEEPHLRRLGFVALFGHERALAGLRNRVQGLLGIWGPHAEPEGRRYFTEREIAGAADAAYGEPAKSG